MDIYITIYLKNSINRLLNLAFQVEFREGHSQNDTTILFSKLSTDHFLYPRFSPHKNAKDYYPKI